MGYIGKERKINLLHSESEKMFRNLVEELRMGVYMADAKGNLLYVNSTFVNILGYQNKDEVRGLNLPNQLYVNPKDRESFLTSMEKTGFVRDYVVKNKRKDGSVAILSATSNYIRNNKEQVIGVEGVVEDITEKVKLEERLKVERSKLEEIVGFDEKVSRIRKFDQLFDFVIERTAKILEAEKCFLMLLDDYHHQLCIKGSTGLDDKHIFETKIKVGDPFAGTVVKDGIPILVKEIESDNKYRKFKKESYLGHTFIIVPIKLEDNVIGVITVADKKVDLDGRHHFNELDLKILCAISREVAVAIENVRLYKELQYLTVTDPLTHIYNFRQFKTSLHHEVNRAKRFSGPLCLMMIDIDNFKSYNDSFGHLEGDELLKKVSEILTKNLREIDIACRYGGDEFAVILPETEVIGAKTVADKIKSEIEKYPFKQKVTLSIGLAKKGDKMNGHDLIQRADSALYEAKDKGKNRACCFV